MKYVVAGCCTAGEHASAVQPLCGEAADGGAGAEAGGGEGEAEGHGSPGAGGAAHALDQYPAKGHRNLNREHLKRLVIGTIHLFFISTWLLAFVSLVCY
jgi:hypothetical protein